MVFSFQKFKEHTRVSCRRCGLWLSNFETKMNTQKEIEEHRPLGFIFF